MIVKLQEKIAADIKADIPDLANKTVKAYAGELSTTTAAQQIGGDVSVFIGCLGFRPDDNARREYGNKGVSALFAAYVHARSINNELKASFLACGIAEMIGAYIHEKQFRIGDPEEEGFEDISQPGKTAFERAVNDFDLGALRKGCVVWSCYFSIPVGMNSMFTPEGPTLYEFTDLCLGTDEQHTPGSTDVEVDTDITEGG